jgi:hypothetical protein
MATVTLAKKSDGVNSFVHGSFTSDGSAQALTLGFNPNYIVVVNETDVLVWERFEPMAAANSLLHTGSTGVITIDTASQILIDDGVVTLGATLVGTSKAIKFRACL